MAINPALLPEVDPDPSEIRRYAHDTDVEYWARKADLARTDEDAEHYDWFRQNAEYLLYLGLQ
jgi:hypothetical protein